MVPARRRRGSWRSPASVRGRDSQLSSAETAGGGAPPYARSVVPHRWDCTRNRPRRCSERLLAPGRRTRFRRTGGQWRGPRDRASLTGPLRRSARWLLLAVADKLAAAEPSQKTGSLADASRGNARRSVGRCGRPMLGALPNPPAKNGSGRSVRPPGPWRVGSPGREGILAAAASSHFWRPLLAGGAAGWGRMARRAGGDWGEHLHRTKDSADSNRGEQAGQQPLSLGVSGFACVCG